MKFILVAILISSSLILGCSEEKSTPTASITPTAATEPTPLISPDTSTPQPSWETIIVDSTGNVGEYSSIAIDSNGKAHIACFDHTEDQLIGDTPVPYGNLKYSHNTDGTWETLTLDTGAGMLPRICIDNNDNVHIVHSQLGTSDLFSILDLKYTTNVSGSWETVTISGQIVKGADSSIAADSNGKVHISTRNEEDTGTTSKGAQGGLRYITNATGEWTWFDVDTTPSSGNDTDITVDHNDKAHISYLDKNAGLKYATNSNGSWEKHIIDDTPNVGWNTSIVVDSNNQVHISYSDPSPILDPPGNGYLKYATNLTGQWTTHIVDDKDAGTYTGMAVDNQDNIHITYCATDGSFGKLMYSTNISGSWSNEIADDDGAALGTYCAIDVDSNGNPHISHYDYVDQNLRYTTRR